MKPLACGMALTLFLQLIQSVFAILDRLCLLVLTFCTVLTIGISVNSLSLHLHKQAHKINSYDYEYHYTYCGCKSGIGSSTIHYQMYLHESTDACIILGCFWHLFDF